MVTTAGPTVVPSRILPVSLAVTIVANRTAASTDHGVSSTNQIVPTRAHVVRTGAAGGAGTIRARHLRKIVGCKIDHRQIGTRKICLRPPALGDVSGDRITRAEDKNHKTSITLLIYQIILENVFSDHFTIQLRGILQL